MTNSFRKIALFILCLLSPLAIGLLAFGLASPGLSTWYQSLNKPSLSVPSNILAYIWLGLFLLMGVALFLVAKDHQAKKAYRSAYLSFSAQLLLSLYWVFLFFYIKLPGLSFWAMISYLSMIIVSFYYLYQIKKTAAWLFFPYLIWISYLGVFNYLIWQLN
ncbi:MAG: TspO/MBR family protein [Patescibacteria group bacterium]|jgi:benzodiazapine receptor